MPTPSLERVPGNEQDGGPGGEWAGEWVVVYTTVGMLSASPAYRSPHTTETEDPHNENQNDGLGAGKTRLFGWEGPTE